MGFIIFGAPFAIFSYLILLSTPLTALGAAFVLVGASTALIPESPVPKQTIRAMVEASCAATESILEEFDAKNKATYLPPREGRVIAYLPTNNDSRTAWNAINTPTRLLGEDSIKIYPPGTEIVRLAALGEESSPDDALSYILVDFLEAADSVKTAQAGRRTIVSIQKPRIRTDFPRFISCLGTLPTSIAGCVIANTINQPVTLSEEQVTEDSITATFEVPRHPGEE